MSHQRYPSHDVAKEPHSISLKVLRLSRPSLVTQHPVDPPLAAPGSHPDPVPGSLAYRSSAGTNPESFILSPILNLPPSFGSAYVGEGFSCTLCANHDGPEPGSGARRFVRDVRIEAEMKTPSSPNAVKLELGPAGSGSGGVDLEPGQTLQKVVDFDLKEEGNHVLSVTVSYYEATETSGRTRTFRKLYQFICKPSLIVRTKAGGLPPRKRKGAGAGEAARRRWVLEAQLENCGEDAIRLERVGLNTEPGLAYEDCNWEASRTDRPVLHPGNVEQVCFVVEEAKDGGVRVTEDGKFVFGVLNVGWRGEMGNRGSLSTGKLGTRFVE